MVSKRGMITVSYPAQYLTLIIERFYVKILPSLGEPKLIKVDVSSHYFELDKDALYIREITIIYRRTCYRYEQIFLSDCFV